MEKIKQQIIEILNKSTDTVYGKGSCGELGDSFQALDSDSFPSVADEITNLIHIVFDPENQPNQLGIKPPFETIPPRTYQIKQ